MAVSIKKIPLEVLLEIKRIKQEKSQGVTGPVDIKGTVSPLGKPIPQDVKSPLNIQGNVPAIEETEGSFIPINRSPDSVKRPVQPTSSDVKSIDKPISMPPTKLDLVEETFKKINGATINKVDPLRNQSNEVDPLRDQSNKVKGISIPEDSNFTKIKRGPSSIQGIPLDVLMKMKEIKKEKGQPIGIQALQYLGNTPVGQFLAKVGGFIDPFTSAPLRSAIGSAISDDLTVEKNPLQAFVQQFGESSTQAPTGKEIAAETGLSIEETIPVPGFGKVSPAGIAGLFIDTTADITNVVPGTTILKATGKGIAKAGVSSSKIALKGSAAATDFITNSKAASRVLGTAQRSADSVKRLVDKLFSPKYVPNRDELFDIARRNEIDPDILPEATSFGEESLIGMASRARNEGITGGKFKELHREATNQVNQALARKIDDIAKGVGVKAEKKLLPPIPIKLSVEELQMGSSRVLDNLIREGSITINQLDELTKRTSKMQQEVMDLLDTKELQAIGSSDSSDWIQAIREKGLVLETETLDKITNLNDHKIAISQINDVANQKVGAPRSKAQAGELIESGMKKAIDSVFEVADTTYKKVWQKNPALYVSDDILSNLDKKLNGIEKIAKGRLIARGKSSGMRSAGNELLLNIKQIKNSRGNYKQLVEQLQAIGDIAFDPKALKDMLPLDIKLRRDMYEAISESLKEQAKKIDPQLGLDLELTNGILTNFFSARTPIMGKMKKGMAPEILFDQLVTRGNTITVRALKNVLPADDFNKIKGAFVHFVAKVNANDIVSFAQTSKKLKEKMDIAKIILSPSELIELQEILTLGKSLGLPNLTTSGPRNVFELSKNKIIGAVIHDEVLEFLKTRAKQTGMNPKQTKSLIQRVREGGTPALMIELRKLGDQSGKILKETVGKRRGKAELLISKPAQVISVQKQEKDDAIKRRLRGK